MNQLSNVLITIICCVLSASIVPVASADFNTNSITNSEQMDTDENSALAEYHQRPRTPLFALAAYTPGKPQNVFNNAERIQGALRRFLSQSNGNSLATSQSGGLLTEPEVRIQTRSMPMRGQETWFESALDSANRERFGRELQTRSTLKPNQSGKDYGDDHLQSAGDAGDQLAASSSVGTSGHKTIRNIQPVFMRLPPRFGKRTC